MPEFESDQEEAQYHTAALRKLQERRYTGFRVDPDYSTWCAVCECATSVGNGHTDVQCVWELKQRLVLLERRVAELRACERDHESTGRALTHCKGDPDG